MQSIFIFGELGVDVTLEAFVASIPKEGDIEVVISSPGGSLDTGIAMKNLLLKEKAKGRQITTIAAGLVASAATLPFMVGDQRLMYPDAKFMAHFPWTHASGNADQLERVTDDLRDAEKSLMDFYLSTVQIEPELLQTIMNNETPLSAEESKKLGFATGVLQPIQAKAVYDLPTNNPNESNSAVMKALNLLNARIDKLFAGITKPEVKNLTLTLDTGDQIEVNTENAYPSVGDTTNAPDGEHTLADGSMIVVENGEITNVMPAESDDEPLNEEAVTQTIEKLMSGVAEMAAELQTQISDIATAVKAQSETFAETTKAQNEQIEKISAMAGSTYSPNPTRVEEDGSPTILSATQKRLQEIQAKTDRYRSK